MSQEFAPEKQTVLDIYKQFQGLCESQPGAEKTLQSLIDLEQEIRKLALSVSCAEKNSLPNNRDFVEMHIMELTTGVRKSIDDLLADLARKIAQLPQDLDIDTFCKKFNIVHVVEKGVLLPPGRSPILAGSGRGFADIPLYPKLNLFINLLHDNRVYTDDIVVVSGDVSPNQMRTESYILVEIPRLVSQVLLCNAYGEASFVYNGMMARKLVFSLSKSELMRKCGTNKLTRIRFSPDDIPTWGEQMKHALFSGKDVSDQSTPGGCGEKVDVKLLEEYRRCIQEQFKTPEQFMRTTYKERTSLSVHGNKLAYIINTVFKLGPIRDAQVYNYGYALLARAVYGEGYSCIDDVIAYEEKIISMSPDDWKRELRNRFSPEDFMQLKQKGLEAIKIFGIGLKFIANTSLELQLEGGPIASKYNQALFAREVYGEGHKCIDGVINDCEKTESWGAEEWKQCIREQYNPETFMSIPCRERPKMAFYKRGLQSIVTILGLTLTKSPNSNNYAYALLARAIYGEGYECIEKVIKGKDCEEHKDRKDRQNE